MVLNIKNSWSLRGAEQRSNLTKLKRLLHPDESGLAKTSKKRFGEYNGN